MVICAVLFLRHSEGSTLAVGISLASAAMAAILFWIVALVAAMLPAAVTYAAARRFGFHGASYYLSSGAVTGLLLAPIVL
jgi:membrane protein DedA with SNARE-associated domain